LKTNLKLPGTCLALALFSILNLCPSTTRAQGSLTPPGAPGPTMLSLSQVEPRIPITSGPFTITNSGSYFLSTNLGNVTFIVFSGGKLLFENTLAGTNAITILANDVTVDLRGYTLTGIPSSTNGIFIGAVTNVTISNGNITGFGNGVNSSGSEENVSVKDLMVSQCAYSGIYLDVGNGSSIKSCNVNTAGSYGMIADLITDSTVLYSYYIGIYGQNVVNCYSITDSDATAIDGVVVYNCSGTCMGTGDGIQANVAENSYGSSNVSGYGLFSEFIAQGCYGYSYDGTGLYALVANSCVGSTESGTGLTAAHNLNSYAY
jgi:hypothetical protein